MTDVKRAVSAFTFGDVCGFRCGIFRLLPLGTDGGCHGNHRPGATHTWHAEQAGGSMEPHCESTLNIQRINTSTRLLMSNVYCFPFTDKILTFAYIKPANIVTQCPLMRDTCWSAYINTKLNLLSSSWNLFLIDTIVTPVVFSTL